LEKRLQAMDIAVKNTIDSVAKKYFLVHPINECYDKWNHITSLNSHISVEYSYWNVIYQSRYFEDVFEEYRDITLLIDNGGVYILWPLCIYKNKEGVTVIGSNGGALLPPVISNMGLHAEAERKIYDKCINFLDEICKCFSIRKCYIKSMVLFEGLSQWDRKILEYGAKISYVGVEAFVDLSLNADEILRRIRRTNRYSIKKGEMRWCVEIVDRNCETLKIDAEIAKFEKLHFEVAGRKTRSEDTWRIQNEAIKYTNDFLVMMYSDENELIGASLFQTTSGYGMYSVAAYKREFFNEPIAHLSQWNAILHMKELDIKWYYIGRRYYICDIENPSEKEVAIGHFKEGFATNLFMSIMYEYSFDNEKA